MSEFYSTADMDNLLLLIKKQNPALKDEQIALEMGYNKDFIFQNRSRGKVSSKFYEALKRYAANLQNASSQEPAAKPAASITNLTTSDLESMVKSLLVSMEQLTRSRIIDAEKDKIDAESRLVDSRSFERLLAMVEKKVDHGRIDNAPVGAMGTQPIT